MAKGIISVKPSAGAPKGKIVVTDGKSSTGSTTQTIEIGTEVDYTRSVNESVGDTVEFIFDPALGAVITNVVATGGKVIGNSGDKLVVAANEVVIITGTQDGKVNVNGGNLILAAGAKVTSKIESATPGSYIISNGALVSAKIEITGASYVSIKKTTVEGKVGTDGTIYTTVRDCTIEGSLEVINTGDCHCSNNQVDGNTNTPNNIP